MKRTFFVGALVALIIPLSASALSIDEIRAQIQVLTQQIQQLQDQLKMITTPTTTPVVCAMDAKVCPDGSSVGRVGSRCEFAACPWNGGPDTMPPAWCAKYDNLIFGARGEDVAALQSAIGEADLGSVATGYYGELTRRVWNKRCVVQNCPTPVCSASSLVCPAGQHVAPAIPVYGANRCQTNLCAQRCVSDPETGGITISGVSGPTLLAVGQQGTWTIQAGSQKNSQLSYSVVWGDEGPVPGIMALAQGGNVFAQTATFTHTYAHTGSYTARFTVRDAVGITADTSLTVRVDAKYPKICPEISVVIDCAIGYHPMSRYSEDGCEIAPKCVPDTMVTATNGALSATPTTGVAPLSVTFTVHNGHSIDFGDGEYATCNDSCTNNWHVTHVYTTIGTFTARIVGTGGGCGGGLIEGDNRCTNPVSASVTVTVSGNQTGCSGMRIAGGYTLQDGLCANPPIVSQTSQNQGILQGGSISNGRICTANGMNFAEGASVSQCLTGDGGTSGICSSFNANAWPIMVCSSGVWVQTR